MGAILRGIFGELQTNLEAFPRNFYFFRRASCLSWAIGLDCPIAHDKR